MLSVNHNTDPSDDTSAAQVTCSHHGDLGLVTTTLTHLSASAEVKIETLSWMPMLHIILKSELSWMIGRVVCNTGTRTNQNA